MNQKNPKHVNIHLTNTYIKTVGDSLITYFWTGTAFMTERKNRKLLEIFIFWFCFWALSFLYKRCSKTVIVGAVAQNNWGIEKVVILKQSSITKNLRRFVPDKR
jgi:hypothetical protein